MKKTLEIDGIKTTYEETGATEAPTVLIMHGWGCTHSTVASIGKALEDKLHVISIDLPGHGETSEPTETWGTFDYARFVKHFLEKLDISCPSVIGHSFGGRTAIALATLIPLNKLVLVDSAGIKPHRSLSYYYKVYTYKTWKKIILLLFGAEKGKTFIEKQLQKKGSADYKSSSPRMRSIMSRCINEDLKKCFPSIACPTLLIWGENDTATPLDDAKKMEAGIPDSGLVSFPGCGHYSFLDNPLGFRSVIREFFKNEISTKAYQ